MKFFLLPVVFCLLFVSCDQKSKVEKAIEETPADAVKVERFDKQFFETSPKDLQKLKKQYPYFFSPNINDTVWTNKMTAPVWREVYAEVEKKYPSSDEIQNSVETLVQHMKYYFPKTKTPKVITLISDMDYNNKAIYADSLIIISLELYLGKDHKFYTFPKYLKQNFEERQMMPDVVKSFSSGKIAPPTDKNLLSQMIYFGKELYLKDILLPEYSDAEKMGYTPEQIVWCQDNESYIWRYFIEREMLFSDEQKLASRFIDPSPFSKFYLEIDNDSPGQVGSWIGWQIVRSFMENNDTKLDQMLKMDAKEIFEKSKYKPKK
ncbi:protein involved in gliding motility GldB [Flavobacterium sp. 1]|uniref:gliding motility lipoprotein GldB n=1 Tax=Flavobacterium sp. 1 TaxID=2035200 RepID=UPI000C247480|nr:gliding motility lipoprotein GldB [Flavobacterium sp. 1]PJJ09421.1 protein involved in gliding motility GldB [Flavobacterium sp. 1]